MQRALSGIIGYRIGALDGEIGRVQDFLFDDAVWRVRYAVVEIGFRRTRSRVLISTSTIGHPEWNGQVLPVGLVIEQVSNSLAEDSDPPVCRQHPSPGLDGGDSHLRSVQELIGYRIHARDGVVGHLFDFVADDQSWSLRDLAISTGRWLPGRTVLVSPDCVESISFDAGEVAMSLSRNDIDGSPGYDPLAPVNRQYEVRLYDYSGRPTDWN